MTNIENLIFLAGLLHFAILSASALAPIVLEWRKHLAGLPTMIRRMMWVYGVFIVFVIIGFGLVSICFAETLTAGSPLARAVCGFIAFFWLARLVVQLTVFDIRPLNLNFGLRMGYSALTSLFVLFTLLYGYAAIHGAGS